MTKEEAIELIEGLDIDENLKKQMLDEANQNGVTDNLISQLKQVAVDAKADIQKIDEMVGMIDKTDADIQEVEKQTADDINQIADDTDSQLKQLEEEANDANAAADTIVQDMDDAQLEQIKQQIQNQ